LQKHRIEKLPVVNKKGELKGLITIKDIEKAQAFPRATKDSHGRLLAGAALGWAQRRKIEWRPWLQVMWMCFVLIRPMGIPKMFGYGSLCF
jgi:hypothetical protein